MNKPRYTRPKSKGRGFFVFKGRLSTIRLLSLQLILLGFVTLAWGIAGYRDAYSSLLGGLACILPNVFYAYQFFRNLHRKSAQQIVMSFYLGEFIKLAVSVSLLLVVLIEINVHLIAFLSGYLVTYIGVWFMPFWRPIR
jgi:ATP synthase protein I